MYILREITEETTFPKLSRRRSNGTRYLYIGSSGRCSVRLLGPMYSCLRIYLNPKHDLLKYFNREELRVMISGDKAKVVAYGEQHAVFRKKLENQKSLLSTGESILEFYHSAKFNKEKHEPDAYLINCLTRQGEFMGTTTIPNIKIMNLAKGTIWTMKEIYGEKLENLTGVVARDILMTREMTPEQIRLSQTMRQIYPAPAPVPVNNDLMAFSPVQVQPNPFIPDAAMQRSTPRAPQPINYLPNDKITYLTDKEIEYVTENGLLDIKESVDFENERTLSKGSGYYVTDLKEIGDEVPKTKFKGKLQKQLIEIEEESEILDAEEKINQIPNDLIGSEIDYTNTILSLDL